MYTLFPVPVGPTISRGWLCWSARSMRKVYLYGIAQQQKDRVAAKFTNNADPLEEVANVQSIMDTVYIERNGIASNRASH
eukprot:scaffold74860_cov22-Tisochrysis_lutea.AAC.1